MPPARVAAPILLNARAASRFSVFSKISEASSHRLAKSKPKIAGMNINIASSSLLSPGSRKGAVSAMTAAANVSTPRRAGRAPQIFIALTKMIARGSDATPMLM